MGMEGQLAQRRQRVPIGMKRRMFADVQRAEGVGVERDDGFHEGRADTMILSAPKGKGFGR